MKLVIFLTLLCSTAINAENTIQSPVSTNATEGKNLYIPPNPPVNLNEEIRIQKEDQNSTQHGGAK